MRKIKISFFLVAAFLLCCGSVSALTINHIGSNISYGDSWDAPPSNVESYLADVYNFSDATLNLVNGESGSEIETWSGDGAFTVLIEEIAGYKDKTKFGWYEVGNSANSSEIYAGLDSPILAKTTTFGDFYSFGLYIDPNGIAENRMYTQHSLNSDGDFQVAIFQVQELPNLFILGWEDLDLLGDEGGDRDYQDMIVALKVRPVNEPATMLLLGTGLIGLAGIGRKKFVKK